MPIRAVVLNDGLDQATVGLAENEYDIVDVFAPIGHTE